ncbi:hypothetical protein AALP_AAs53838U000100 [Arabis alpina]|uniref:Uncharacterized protein n=1 Tax=Arabis alpina TaxID=50452 RepID=A0A087FXY8_ARAAL|nr:hypothetical protein AALP_AAs53838U000100 [Arabis alpina]
MRLKSVCILVLRFFIPYPIVCRSRAMSLGGCGK